MAPRKKGDTARAVERLDRAWSTYVRYSAAGPDGTARCYTCDRSEHPKKLHAGHFQSRRYYATRWDPDNSRPQCIACNRYHQGRQWEFGRNLDRERPGLAEEVYERSRRRTKLDRAVLLSEARRLEELNAGLVARVEGST